MIILGKHNTPRIEQCAVNNGQVTQYHIWCDQDPVGYLEFHPEIHEWGLETNCGFSVTSGFLTQIWSALIADLESQLSNMKG